MNVSLNISPVVLEVDYRIDNQLTGTMIGNISSPVGEKECDAFSSQFLSG
jgi:ribosome-associated toxin RatA of RatAB toxin-antitoxin module